MKLPKKMDVTFVSFRITQMGYCVKVARDVHIEMVKPAGVALLTKPRFSETDECLFRFYSRGSVH